MQRFKKDIKKYLKTALNTLNDIADGIFVVGHIKRSIHYVLKDRQWGNKLMKSASRMIRVMRRGTLGFLTAGQKVPLFVEFLKVNLITAL